ncbi:F-box DNA helicase 1 [Lamellibrachia satsuma]|nr:F-box DNA helicase 1 [Lamellibrachia satsuma]
MPWKKQYCRLTMGDPVALESMKNLLERHEMSTPDTYLPGMIRWMKDLKPLTASNMEEYLHKHPLYTTAASMITERLSECLCKGVPSPWCVMAAIAVLADTVAQLQRLLQCLLGGTSQCTVMEVLESCYCIACFLRVFQSIKYKDIWTVMHYRMYYALYLFENESVSTCGELAGVFSERSGQQSLVKYSSSGTNVRLTHEQLRICNHNVQSGQLVKIIAFAGTGKTTTLIRYTQLRPNLKFLFVVYNKSVCELSKSKFPRNVTCKTGHALAFQTMGRRYASAKQLWSNVRLTAITDLIPKRKGLSLYVRAKFVLDTLKTFFASADQSITTAHVPTEKVDNDGQRMPLDHAIRMEVAEDAGTLWMEMKNIHNISVGMTHDGYLKLYQLSQPRLYQYDVILIDEAQDLTPAIADVLLRQPQPKILVGDPHQQIYSFRGAVNSMQLVNATHTYYLTQSFRFGPEIAFVAATFLGVLKGEKKTLVGNGIPGSILGGQVGQLAVITRTNYTLFMEAVKKCCYSDENIRIAFVGGTEAFGFSRILDIYSLMLSPQDRAKRPIGDAFVRNFDSLADLERYATQVMDHELLGKIRIVKTCHHNLPSLIAKIRSKAIGDTDTADVVFSTAHKSKGLEFSTVKVTDDFQALPNPDSFRLG